MAKNFSPFFNSNTINDIIEVKYSFNEKISDQCSWCMDGGDLYICSNNNCFCISDAVNDCDDIS
jgi:hypothetical protein